MSSREQRKNKLTEAQQASVLRYFREWRDSLPELRDAAAGQVLGLSQPSINAIKKGRANLSATTLILLRGVTGIAIDDLLGLPPLTPPTPAMVVSDRDAAIEAAIERALARRLDTPAEVPPPIPRAARSKKGSAIP